MIAYCQCARLGSLAMLFTLCCMLTGCGSSKVNKENFDKIVINESSLQEVERILGGSGTPQGGGDTIGGAAVGVDLSSGAKQSSIVEYKWESGQNSITVGVRQGKVIAKRKTGF